MLYRLRRQNQRWRSYTRFLIMENRWRAQRYGIDEHLIDFGRTELVPVADLVDELIELTRDDAAALGCTQEIAHLRTILARRTSADRQLATYQKTIEAGGREHDALCAVVDCLIAETVEGCSLARQPVAAPA